MIGTINIKLQASNPQRPIDPLMSFVNSPSSIRLLDVPKKIGSWEITQVFIQATYPDGSIKNTQCVRNGNIYVGTIEGSTISGSTTDGFVVFANGKDENGNPVNGYVLGKGDVYIYTIEGQIEPETTVYNVRWFNYIPENPAIGDCVESEGGIKIWNGIKWVGSSKVDRVYNQYGNQFIQGDGGIWTIRDAYDYYKGSGYGYDDIELIEDEVTHEGEAREWLWNNPDEASDYVAITAGFIDGEGMCVWKLWLSNLDYPVSTRASADAKQVRFKIPSGGNFDIVYMEDGEITQKVGQVATQDEVPIKLSQLENDSNYIKTDSTNHISIVDTSVNDTARGNKYQTIQVKSSGGKMMVYGVCTDQTDGTGFIGGLFADNATSFPYRSGLAIGGTSGNLLWKGNVVATTNQLPTKTSQLTNDSGFLNIASPQTITGAKTFSTNINITPNTGVTDSETTNWLIAKGTSEYYNYNNKPLVYVGLKDSYLMLRGIDERPMYRHHTDLNNYTLSYLALTSDLDNCVKTINGSTTITGDFNIQSSDMPDNKIVWSNEFGYMDFFGEDNGIVFNDGVWNYFAGSSYLKVDNYNQIRTDTNNLTQYVNGLIDNKIGNIETILSAING